MIESLKSNTYVWAILAICSLIGIPSFLFAIYTWIKSKKKKLFSIAKTKYQIIRTGKNVIEDLKLSFREKEIEDLTITKLAIWNSGNQEIRQEDIASEGPLRIISTGDANILAVSILTQSDPSNQFLVTLKNEKEALIQFEYVNCKDGIVLQVLHSGDSANITFDCKIKGGTGTQGTKKKKRHIMRRIGGKKKKNAELFSLCTDFVLVMILIVYAFLQEIQVIPSNWPFKATDSSMIQHPRWGILAFMLFILVFFVFTFIRVVRISLHLDIPEPLRAYIEIDQN